MTESTKDDGFIDPNHSPKNEKALSPAEVKVNMWKKMILQGE